MSTRLLQRAKEGHTPWLREHTAAAAREGGAHTVSDIFIPILVMLCLNSAAVMKPSPSMSKIWQ